MKPRIVSKAYRKANSLLCIARLKTGLYSRRSLPEYDFAWLQKHWPYVDPECVRDDYHRPAAQGVDLSICVPMYNVAGFIEKLLNAIAAQKTSYSYEVILVDDGSKDRTAEIVSRTIKEKENFILVRQENGGISVARNTALDHARGEYISFVDSDDMISEDYIQSLMTAAKENDADIVKGKCCIRRGEQIIPMGYAFVFLWGGVYRAALYDRVRFPAGYWYEDMVNQFLIMPQAKKTVTIDQVTLYYNDTEGSASKLQARSKNYKSLEQIYLVMSLTRDYKKLGLHDRVYLYQRLVAECSQLLARRTHGLDETTRMQVFLAAHQLFRDEKVDPAQFSGTDRIFVDAILNKDYGAWELAAKL